MGRLKYGFFLSIVLAVGAGVGTAIFSSDPESIVTSVIGAAFWGFVFGLFMGGKKNEEN